MTGTTSAGSETTMDEQEPKRRVTGLGGIFFKAHDPAALQAWYNTHLGLPLEAEGVGIFRWREWDDPAQPGSTVWAAFAADTEYFAPSAAPFMLNYRVADLDALLAALRAEGVQVMDE